jgi:16S rRNA (guanine(966)-N(2))-methyltransferase RsmD
MDGRYLDLFSGTGSYLFEATSRGAKTVVGVELEPQLADSINNHAKSFGVSDRMRCLQEDVFKAIPKFGRTGQQFDIIMVAPPQYKGLIERTLAELHEQTILAPGGQILCQHDTSETRKLRFEHFEIVQQRAYGNTTFTILHPKQ